MTVAFALYATAIFLGRSQRKWKLPRWVHFSTGAAGFVLDMWATWDMEQLRVNGQTGFEGSYLLLGHTIVSSLAVVLFLIMITLAISGKIAAHRMVVWYAFAPVWFISYTSGILMVSINDDQLMAKLSPDSVIEKKISEQNNKGLTPINIAGR